MMYYHARNRETIKSLNPVARKQVEILLHNLDVVGENVLIYDADRTPEGQDAEYAKGRTEEGDIVTHVNDSNSYHVWGMAIDLVPVNFRGETLWNAEKRYVKIARMAKELGFDWGYQMWGFDMPHFQYTQGLTIEDLKQGWELKEENDQIVYDPALIAKWVREGGALSKLRLRWLERLLKRLKRMYS